jgi:ribosome maturation factor RimP
MSARQPARRAAPTPPGGRGPRPGRPDPARRDAVVALLAPLVSAAGLDLEDVELRSVGRRLVLRVLVDGESGVSLDQVAEVSRAVSEALDDAEPLGDEPYTLEVSSPGVDRPLTEPRHWRRNVGRLVAVTLVDGREVTGRVLSVADDGGEVELELDTKGRTSTRAVALADVRRALVQVEFSRAAEADLGPEEDSVGHLVDDDDATPHGTHDGTEV